LMLLRTLIVEDNGIAAIYLKKQLEQIGAEDIEIVMSGEEAVQKASSCEFDVIFMDIRLKGEMDGIEAAGIILGHKPVRLIFLTGNSDLPTKERALQLNP
ncbi:MAG: response regulator, partial [candidate division Zixibacteria bacterium]|nr:response regulator [candidate division Zixibacteria bacterium]NIR65340.1 response regulator [candidate division Zixibacteria bacterium]NIS47323.1 response regulator [candidate division Zixibacteria bacterium]NIU15439.1 response regulator [candidate division Zixibacteria bacterium]NIV07259.1 response regulator [candidate division Zixibacteria bacterium]